MKREDYSINISVKNNQNIPNETEKLSISSFPIISLWDRSCHSNQSSYPIGTKTQLFVLPTYGCYMRNMKKIGLMASEEMSFENVFDGRTTDTFIYYKLRLT